MPRVFQATDAIEQRLKSLGAESAAALLLTRNLNVSYAQLKSPIIDNVDPLPAFAGKTVSGGPLAGTGAVASTAPTPAAAASLFSTPPLIMMATRDLVATTDVPLV